MTSVLILQIASLPAHVSESTYTPLSDAPATDRLMREQ